MLGLVLGALAVFALLLGDTDRLRKVVASVQLGLLIPAFLAFVAATLLRALRFQLLMRAVAPYPVFLRITAAYQAWRAVAPAQLGELSYPLLLKRSTGHSRSEGLGDLVLVRVMDLAVLAIVLIAGALSLGLAEQERSLLLLAGATVLVVSIGGLLILPQMIAAARRLFLARRRKHGGPPSRLSRIAGKLEKALRRHRRGALGIAAALTLLIAVGAALRVYCQVAALGVSVTLAEAAFIFAAHNLLALLPLKAVGGFGIKQAGLVGVLLMLGYEVEQAAILTGLFSITALAFPASLLPFGWKLFTSQGKAV